MCGVTIITLASFLLTSVAAFTHPHKSSNNHNHAILNIDPTLFQIRNKYGRLFHQQSFYRSKTSNDRRTNNKNTHYASIKSQSTSRVNRRKALSSIFLVAAGVTSPFIPLPLPLSISPKLNTRIAYADDDLQVSAEELETLYENPEIPPAPEERSGLTVLRVAEVAQFQEKILLAVANGDLPDTKVAPMQFTFGTKILLKNSNLDGNMKLMIQSEIPKKQRKAAAIHAANTMNILQDIIKYTSTINRDFETTEMLELAQMYQRVRVELNEMYEFLPQKEKDKYYGYFVKVTEYEKKIADGVYNPDLDGVLKFD